jgi:hypothetical protein
MTWAWNEEEIAVWHADLAAGGYSEEEIAGWRASPCCFSTDEEIAWYRADSAAADAMEEAAEAKWILKEEVPSLEELAARHMHPPRKNQNNQTKNPVQAA